MARVPYVQREQLKPEEQKHFDAMAGSRGRVGPNFQTLLNSPEAGGRSAGFGEYVRFHGDVPERLKEWRLSPRRGRPTMTTCGRPTSGWPGSRA